MPGKQLTLAIINAMALALGACGAEDRGMPPRLSTPKEDVGEGDATKKPPSAIVPPLEQDEEEYGDDEANEANEANEADVSLELARQCGDVDLDNAATPVVDLAMKSLPIVMRGQRSVIGFPVNYEVTAIASLGIKANLVSSVSTTAFESITASPRLAQNSAEDEAAQQSGTTTTEFARDSDRSISADTVPGWKDIVCTVQGASRITSAVGAGNVAASFEPPLPVSIAPRAVKERYELEIGTARAWTGIKAKVQQSSHPAVETGMEYTGNVTLNRIDPTLVVTGADGAQQTVNADLAFELTADFGGAEITAALGLRPSTKFYVDLAAKKYKAIVAQVKDGATAPAIFIAP